MSGIPVSRSGRSGDHLVVGPFDLGGVRRVVEAEYQRAKSTNPENPAFNMRPMFYTGSPYGAEILNLAMSAHPDLRDAIAAYLEASE